jgi:hypothetical protein
METFVNQKAVLICDLAHLEAVDYGSRRQDLRAKGPNQKICFLKLSYPDIIWVIWALCT